MTDRVIETEADRNLLYRFIAAQKKLPFTVTVTRGKKRTVEQNKLQRLWQREISEQLGDRTPEEVRGYCKLHFGVPIMRAANDAFAEKYDRLIRPFSYAEKLELMMIPMDFPVTRMMSTKQHTEYLDQVHKHFTEQGVVLTDPDPIAHSVEAEHA